MASKGAGRPLDPGGAQDTKGKATRIGPDGFIREDFPGYDPADYQPAPPAKPRDDVQRQSPSTK